MYQRKEINFYQISGSDSLPEDGWFQNCKCCKRTITGNLKLITTVEGIEDVKYFRIYTCKECEKQLKKDAIKYIKTMQKEFPKIQKKLLEYQSENN